MFIVSKRNIILPSKDGTETYFVPRGYIGSIPNWAAETEYFRALVIDGKIGTPEGRKDKAVEAEAVKPVRKRKASEE